MGLWIVLPLVSLSGHFKFLPIYRDFGTELPPGTSAVCNLRSAAALAIMASAVVAATLLVPRGSRRSIFLMVSALTAVLALVGFVYLLFMPFVVIIDSLN